MYRTTSGSAHAAAACGKSSIAIAAQDEAFGFDRGRFVRGFACHRHPRRPSAGSARDRIVSANALPLAARAARSSRSNRSARSSAACGRAARRRRQTCRRMHPRREPTLHTHRAGPRHATPRDARLLPVRSLARREQQTVRRHETNDPSMSLRVEREHGVYDPSAPRRARARGPRRRCARDPLRTMRLGDSVDFPRAAGPRADRKCRFPLQCVVRSR